MSEILSMKGGYFSLINASGNTLALSEGSSRCTGLCTCCGPSGIDAASVTCSCSGGCFNFEYENADTLAIYTQCFSGFVSYEIFPGVFEDVPSYTVNTEYTTGLSGQSDSLSFCGPCRYSYVSASNGCGSETCIASCLEPACGIRETRTDEYIRLEFLYGYTNGGERWIFDHGIYPDSLYCKGPLTVTSNDPRVFIGAVIDLPYGPSMPEEITYEISNNCGAPARCVWRSNCCDRKTHILITLTGVPDAWWRRTQNAWSIHTCIFYYLEITGLGAGNGTYSLPIRRVSTSSTFLSCAIQTDCGSNANPSRDCFGPIPCGVFSQIFEVGEGTYWATRQGGATLSRYACEECNSGLCYNAISGRFISCTNDVVEWWNYPGVVEVSFSCRDGMIAITVALKYEIEEGEAYGYTGIVIWRIVGTLTDNNIYPEYPNWTDCDEPFEYLGWYPDSDPPCYIEVDRSNMRVQLQYV